MKPPDNDPKLAAEVLEDIAVVPGVLRLQAGLVFSDMSEGILLVEDAVLVLVWL